MAAPGTMQRLRRRMGEHLTGPGVIFIGKSHLSSILDITTTTEGTEGIIMEAIITEVIIMADITTGLGSQFDLIMHRAYKISS